MLIRKKGFLKCVNSLCLLWLTYKYFYGDVGTMDQHSLHLQTQGNSCSSYYPLRSEWKRKGLNLRAYSQFFYCQRKNVGRPPLQMTICALQGQ